MRTWLLVDGFNMAFRSFYAVPELTRPDGFPTNAIHGWTRTLWKLEDGWKPERLAVFFDLGGAARQAALQADYKAHRPETPPALERQIPVIKQITVAMGYGGHEQEGVEADDLIGATAVKLASEGRQVKIVSADKDFAQCVRPGITLLRPPPAANPKTGWRELDETGVKSKFGVAPGQIADYLALAGDTPDNIRGLPGVGPKTAAKWLNQYGCLEEIIQNCGTLRPARFQSAVYENRDLLRRNLQIITLDTGLPPAILDAPPPDREKILRLLDELQMTTARREALRRYPQK